MAPFCSMGCRLTGPGSVGGSPWKERVRIFLRSYYQHDTVVTSAAKAQLEFSGLSGFTFQPVEKVLTVELRWETWDLTADEPQYFPDSGEPEDYVLGQPNSPAASAALGELGKSWSGKPQPLFDHCSPPAECTFVRRTVPRFEHLERCGPFSRAGTWLHTFHHAGALLQFRCGGRTCTTAR
jgi:hypothetical protein